MSPHISILVFDGVEVLDFAGPYEVFTTASRVHSRANPDAAPLFTVACVSRDGQAITARAGLRVLPEFGFDNCPPAAVLVVPGGVVDAAMTCQTTLNWISRSAAQAQVAASVCTGVFLLAQCGFLTTDSVTTHWEDVSELRARFPLLTVRDDVRWLDNGACITSAGISAGIDMSLHLVARLAGKALAQRTARQMDYEWHSDASR